MQTRRLSKQLPTHPTLTLHGQPVRALGWGKRGELIWPVHGGNGDDDPDADEKKFTQADVDRMTAEARSRGERKGKEDADGAKFSKFLEDAGLPANTKPEDVKKALEDKRAAELKDLDEKDRKIAEAEDRAKQAEAREQALKEQQTQKDAERFEEKVADLIKAAGVGKDLEKDPAKRDAAVASVRRMLDVKVGTDSDDVRKAIEGLKESFPGLFPDPDDEGGENGGSGGGLVDGRPGGAPGKKQQTGRGIDKEAARKKAIEKGWAKPPEAKAG